jgi:hypothetical protein
VLSAEKASAALQDAAPIENYAEVEHVVVNRGPSIDWVEQAAGPLPRAKVEDLAALRGLERTAPGAPGEQPLPRATGDLQSFRQATESAAAQARTIMQQKQSAPVVIPRIRLSDATPRPQAPAKKGFQPARTDSLH